MTNCPQCNAENLPGMAYCEQCGAPLPAATTTSAPAPSAPPPAPAIASDSDSARSIAGAQAVLDALGREDDVAASGPAAATPEQAAPAPVPSPPAPSAAAPEPVEAELPVSATPLAATAVPTMSIVFGDTTRFSVRDDVTNVGRADVAQNWQPELDVISLGGGDPNFGVSRHQAVIRRDGAAFSVIDVGSTNGTYVNGHLLEYNKASDLHDGDTLAFGAFSGTIKIG
jgi:hypothetical protein